MKTWFAFLIVLPLVVAVPARAATPQPIVFSESTPNVTLDTPGLHDLATAAPGTTLPWLFSFFPGVSWNVRKGGRWLRR